MTKITFLGPYGATFSHDAYLELSNHYKAPTFTDANYVTAGTNDQVLGIVTDHGGYGAIAMETAAQGRVIEPVESFIQLLETYDQNHACPISVTGAVRMRLNFNLMARPGVHRNNLTSVICHTKSEGACRDNLLRMGLPVIHVGSNGEAARLVAESAECQNFAAIGPTSAVETYGLEVLQVGFEDKPAFTTFFLISPTDRPIESKEHNRALLVFEVEHKPNALVSALAVLGNDEFNLIHVHSMPARNSGYHFCVEVEVAGDHLTDFRQTLKNLEAVTNKRLVFGPFEVYQQ